MKPQSKYSEKLRDPRWQKKRLEVMQRDQFTCQRCSNNESTLNVHHKYYKAGADPWEYELDSLVTLCESCHEFEAAAMSSAGERLKEALIAGGFLGDDSFAIARGLANWKPQLHREVDASMIEFALSDPAMCASIHDAYFEHLDESRRTNEDKNG